MFELDNKTLNSYSTEKEKIETRNEIFGTK